MDTANVIIDWDSKKTEILLNPRIGDDERLKIRKSLSEITDFPSHVWLATSGTTAAAKFVALSKEAILCSARAVNKHINSSEEDIWLHALADFHVGGVGIWARSHLSGSKVVKYEEKWDAQKFVSLVASSVASLTSLVPAQIYDLVQQELHCPKCLRGVFVGGGALVDDLFFSALSLGWKIWPTYGLSECSSQVATAKSVDRKIYPLDHVQVKIDKENNIFIKSKALFSTYAYIGNGAVKLHDPKIDGWFKTEDRAKMVNGCLTVFGRDTDFIKIGGEGVNLSSLQKKWMSICLQKKLNSKTSLIASKDPRLGHVIHLLVHEKTSKIESLVCQYNKTVLPFAKIRKVIEF